MDTAKRLLMEIYDKVVQNEPDAIRLNHVMDEEIIQMMDSMKDKIAEQDQEEIRNRFFDVAFSAQRKGFLLGMQYAGKLYVEITGITGH